MAGHNHRDFHLSGVVGRHVGCVVPSVVSLVAVPVRHVRAHSASLGVHHFRIRGHKRPRRAGRVRERLQGVPPRELLYVAAEKSGQAFLLGQDQELPHRCQGLQRLGSKLPDLNPIWRCFPLTRWGIVCVLSQLVPPLSQLSLWLVPCLDLLKF